MIDFGGPRRNNDRMRCAIALTLVVGTAGARADVSVEQRAGIYADGDRTTVIRSLTAASATSGRWTASAHESVDVVTSASTDVRSSAHLDALSSASAVHPQMSDRRFETQASASWNDGTGHQAGFSLVGATERDYTSLGGGLSGSFDLRGRNTTLLAGLDATANHVTSVDDPAFDERMGETGYSAGVAEVVTPADALRFRYDGSYAGGYQASPYRTVRFGDWRTAFRPGGDGLLFLDTIGPAGGLPEKLPDTRLRHALVGEWLHAIGDRLGLLVQARGSTDDWGVSSAGALGELRFASARMTWRASVRLYAQRAASFYREKYVMAASAYDFYTSDKELGVEYGAIGSFDAGWSLGRGFVLDGRVEVMGYAYPEFALLGGRAGIFGELGLGYSR
jgi:hypothetical protein